MAKVLSGKEAEEYFDKILAYKQKGQHEDIAVSTVAVAFQVLRSEALKQREGQYFTPRTVIEAGVRLMQIKWVIDDNCSWDLIID